MMEIKDIDNSAMYEMAFFLLIIFIFMGVGGFVLGKLASILKFPKELLNFAIAIGCIGGMIFGFRFLNL